MALAVLCASQRSPCRWENVGIQGILTGNVGMAVGVLQMLSNEHLNLETDAGVLLWLAGV